MQRHGEHSPDTQAAESGSWLQSVWGGSTEQSWSAESCSTGAARSNHYIQRQTQITIPKKRVSAWKGWSERRWFRCVLTWSLLSKAAVAPSPLFSSTTTTMWVREFTLTCSISRSSCRSWNTGATLSLLLRTTSDFWDSPPLNHFYTLFKPLNVQLIFHTF